MISKLMKHTDLYIDGNFSKMSSAEFMKFQIIYSILILIEFPGNEVRKKNTIIKLVSPI